MFFVVAAVTVFVIGPIVVVVFLMGFLFVTFVVLVVILVPVHVFHCS